ncbi:protein CcmA, bactofilin family [Pseudorhodobacter antarcticus]|jgi:cytoskeletal protein CcmA (bactofilin family)|uniref:Protein CcmA, bactofilin family n=1 Tax=Pseudorhodobacter antarcticus TaxID=1077947 RepID=A0A1H8LP30_9RHOB|nr:polymer-forming cytoskeletal protein [Pseudorhodobacter antarcticus]SEO06902.1 protein CcmA, bactofilin family [Pseudorhodobacter antarcticus]
MSNSSPAGKSVLASDLKITGDIVSKGSIEVMGEIDGSITADSVIVSHEGNVKGTIAAKTVDMRGSMNGKVDSGTLTLRSAAQVTAEVVYTTLSIESGAQVEGSFKIKKA